ncbi:hypothetical protein EYF80_050550 [Liparis tanakae]|uniref:Uncharacterized protein n=1 Tax=Liparis tanakae TaxID=230148 RepID=A0A4Z2FE77_9TELE|nr:hypothetical protein EYF80_050550 [Liparis tanakae]
MSDARHSEERKHVNEHRNRARLVLSVTVSSSGAGGCEQTCVYNPKGELTGSKVAASSSRGREGRQPEGCSTATRLLAAHIAQLASAVCVQADGQRPAAPRRSSPLLAAPRRSSPLSPSLVAVDVPPSETSLREDTRLSLSSRSTS